MRLAEPVLGAAFGLRSPRNGDAEFTVRLRSDPGASRFLHRIPDDVASQRRWEDAALARHDDLPLIVFRTTTDAAVGTAGIYNIDREQRRAEWGRWVISRGSLAAVESVLLILRVAFEQLSLESLYARTLAQNARVISFHDRAGFARVGQAPIDVDGADELCVEHVARAADVQVLRRRLEPVAERVARHLA